MPPITRAFVRHYWLLTRKDNLCPKSDNIVLRLINLSAWLAPLFLLTFFSSTQQTFAATDSWDGNVSANWADLNWSPSGDNPPQTGDSLVFGAQGTFGSTLTDNLMTPATYTIDGITFNPGAAAFVINSGTAGSNGFTLAGSITNSSSSLETINEMIVLAGQETFAMTGGGNLDFQGPIGGSGGIMLSGTGIVTLSGNDSYTGETQVPIATLNITGTIGTMGTPSGVIMVGEGSNAGVSPTLNVNGGIIYATSLTQDDGAGTGSGLGTFVTLSGNGAITLTGNLAVDANNGDDVGLLTLTSGTLTANSATIGRSNDNLGSAILTMPISNSTGLYMDGGTLDLATTLDIGNNANSSGIFRIDSGSAVVVGVTSVTNNAASRFSVLNVNGGTFTDEDTSGIGISVGGIADTNGLEDAELLVTSGTLITPAITLDGAAQTSGNDVLFADGGVTYVGAGGIVSGGGGSAIGITLGDNFVIAVPTIAASANWSSSLPMSLSGNAAGSPVIFQAANSVGAPELITLGGTLSGAGGISVTGDGTLDLSGPDSFGGGISIASGANLQLSDGGNLGSGAYSGSIEDSGTFTYASTVNQTLSGEVIVAVGGALVQDGPGTLSLTSGANMVAGSVIISSGTLVISGAGTLSGWSSSAIVSDAGTFSFAGTTNQTLASAISGSGGVAEVGTGNLTLSGANTYTGPTTVTSGTLVLASTGSLGNTAITVSSGAGLLAESGSGNVKIGSGGASLTLNAGAGFSLADGAIGTVTLNSGAGTALTLEGNTVSPDGLIFDVGQAGADELIVPNGTVSFAANPRNDIILDALSTGVPSSPMDIPILAAPGGLLSLSDFFLETESLSFNGTIYDAALSLGGAGTELLVSFTPGSTPNYYFTGAQSSSWSIVGNFATDHTGAAAQSSLPVNTSNVFLTADAATNFQTETLDGNFIINSLSFTGTDSAVGNTPAAIAGITLAGGTATAPLVIDAGNSFTDSNGNNYPGGIGLVVQATSAAHTITANIDLGSSQTWEIDNSPANPLTVSGIVADGSTQDSLTKTGSGTLILSNSNTYDGGTIISAGMLTLGPGGSLASSGTLTVQGMGTFDLAGRSQTVGGLSDGGVSTGTITSSTGAATLTINNKVPDTYSGTITDNNAINGASLALLLDGSSLVTLSGSNNFTGNVTLRSGDLIVAGNDALGDPFSANPNAGLTIDSGTANFTSADPNIASLNGTGAVVLGNSAGGGSATTLNIGGGGPGQITGDTFTGTISDLSSGAPGAVGNLNVYGGAFLALTSANTFTGTTTVSSTNASALTDLYVENPLGLENSTLVSNNSFGEILFENPADTIGGLTGSAPFSLFAAGNAPLELTVGNDNVSSSFAGPIAGPGGIIKTGDGTLTLAGSDSYIGGTTVDEGTLTITGALGSVGTPSGAVFVGEDGTNAAASIVLDVNGAAVYAQSLMQYDGNAGGGPSTLVEVVNNGFLALTGTLAVNASDGDNAGLVTITSGTVSAVAATISRDSLNLGANTVSAGSATDGIYVNGGTLDIATTLTLAGSNSSANMRIDAGVVNVGGVVTITDLRNTRMSVLDINGGTFTDMDTSGIGIEAGGGAGATANDGFGELLVRGNGVLITPAVTLGSAVETGGGLNAFVVIGGVAYIGSGGIVTAIPNGSSATNSVLFGSVSAATVPTIAATASWSSSLNITLNDNTDGATPIFQTSAGNNITLAGVLQGTGGLTAQGTGILTLSNADLYAGPTYVNGGTVIITGSIEGTDGAIVASGARLEVDGPLNNGFSVPVSGELSGDSSLGGVIVTSGTLAPGDTIGGSRAGTLEVYSNSSLDANSTFSIRVGLTNGVASNSSDGLGGDADQLLMSGGGGALTLDDSFLAITTGAAENNPALIGNIYVILNDGGQYTGAGSDVFGNAPASGDAVTHGGYTYDVYYAVNANNTGPGDDIDLKLAAIPEPGTWASLLSGLALLIVSRRKRRRG